MPSPDEDSTTPYAQSGTTLTLDQGKVTVTFCRKGGELILDWTPHPKTWRYWILRRP